MTSVSLEMIPRADRFLRRVRLQEYALVGIVVLLVIAGAATKPSAFLTSDNFFTVMTQASVVGVLAIGMTFVIASGGIDLSVGSLVAAAGIAGGVLADTGGGFLFILVAIVFGAALGAVNGAAITWGRVVPFIATLAMLTIARGLALRMSGKTPISVVTLDRVRWFGNGKFIGVPAPVIVFVMLTVVGWVVLNRTAYGRYVVATGGNREAARIAGIRVRRTIFSVYVVSGLCAGISAVLLTGRLATASPVAGSLYELDAIAAVVIGGTSLSGGRATIGGTFIGVLTFALIFNLLNLLNLPTEFQLIVKGVIVLVAVVAQRREN
ncbi:MAG TPA: ABC transporter permease [Actinomycetota bacterium]|jgi:ribose transport system permease protein|nr:ABC transporter permease [Actinomycetota bacterium]